MTQLESATAMAVQTNDEIDMNQKLVWNFILVSESRGIMLLSFDTDQEISHASLDVCVDWGSVSYLWGLNVLVRPRTKLSSQLLFQDRWYISGRSVLHKLYLFRRLEEASSSDFSIIMARMNHKTWLYRYMTVRCVSTNHLVEHFWLPSIDPKGPSKSLLVTKMPVRINHNVNNGCYKTVTSAQFLSQTRPRKAWLRWRRHLPLVSGLKSDYKSSHLGFTEVSRESERIPRDLVLGSWERWCAQILWMTSTSSTFSLIMKCLFCFWGLIVPMAAISMMSRPFSIFLSTTISPIQDPSYFRENATHYLYSIETKSSFYVDGWTPSFLTSFVFTKIVDYICFHTIEIL